jgi:hypothetical protein
MPERGLRGAALVRDVTVDERVLDSFGVASHAGTRGSCR